jgi:lipid-A-disaccharide synthase
LEKKLHKRGIKTVHYVSPSIWAWRKSRIKTIRKSVDKVLCLLPFEPDLYHAYGVPAVFVGHPLVKKLPYEMKKYTAREKLQISSETVIAVLPGSRLSEIKKLGPIFARVAKLIASQSKKISFVSPMASQSTYDQFENILLSNNIRSAFKVIKGSSHEAMIAADIVLLASGTAALESALLSKPTVAAYKVSALSYFILNKLVKTSYFTLPNILLNKEIIPEFIQNKASDINLFDSISECLYNKHYQQNMINNFTQLKSQLDADTDKLAASEVLKLL